MTETLNSASNTGQTVAPILKLVRKCMTFYILSVLGLCWLTGAMLVARLHPISIATLGASTVTERGRADKVHYHIDRDAGAILSGAV